MLAEDGVRYVEGPAESLPPIAVLLREAHGAFVVDAKVARTSLPDDQRPYSLWLLGHLDASRAIYSDKGPLIREWVRDR
jgi:hypothetical protein